MHVTVVLVPVSAAMPGSLHALQLCFPFKHIHEFLTTGEQKAVLKEACKQIVGDVSPMGGQLSRDLTTGTTESPTFTSHELGEAMALLWSR